MILNLTQHTATVEQLTAGVCDLPVDLRPVVGKLLTFEDIPSKEDICKRAHTLAMISRAWFAGMDPMSVFLDDFVGFPPLGEGGDYRVMVGGALWLMRPLSEELIALGLTPVFAFSVRESVDTMQADGSVRKSQIFRHRGFVSA